MITRIHSNERLMKKPSFPHLRKQGAHLYSREIRLVGFFSLSRSFFNYHTNEGTLPIVLFSPYRNDMTLEDAHFSPFIAVNPYEPAGTFAARFRARRLPKPHQLMAEGGNHRSGIRNCTTPEEIPTGALVSLLFPCAPTAGKCRSTLSTLLREYDDCVNCDAATVMSNAFQWLPPRDSPDQAAAGNGASGGEEQRRRDSIRDTIKAVLEQFDVVVPDTALSLEDEVVRHIRLFLEVARRSSRYVNLQSAAPYAGALLSIESPVSPTAAAAPGPLEGSLSSEANISCTDWPNLPEPGTTSQGERARPTSHLTHSDATSAFLPVNRDGSGRLVSGLRVVRHSCGGSGLWRVGDRG